VEWHAGFRLNIEELQRHPHYRGSRYIELGCLLAQDGHIDPKIIGDAAQTGHYDEQALKRVWHYLARFGAPGLVAISISVIHATPTEIVKAAVAAINAHDVAAIKTVWTPNGEERFPMPCAMVTTR